MSINRNFTSKPTWPAFVLFGGVVLFSLTIFCMGYIAGRTTAPRQPLMDLSPLVEEFFHP